MNIVNLFIYLFMFIYLFIYYYDLLIIGDYLFTMCLYILLTYLN